MGSKSKSPPPPDTVGAAKAEAAGNKEVAQITAGYNRPTQIDPYGMTTWTFKGKGGTVDPALQKRVADAQRAYDAALKLPTGGGKNNPGAGQDRQRQIDAALANLNAAKAAIGPSMGTADNPRPGDWVQTTTLTPQQQAILNAEQGNDLALQQLASQGVGIAQNVLGKQWNPQGLPAMQGLRGIGASSIPLPSANFRQFQGPQFQGSQMALPTWQGPTGSMPTLQGMPGGAVQGFQGMQGGMAGITGPQGSMPQFQGNTGQVAGITGPQGNVHQLGADTVGMAQNRLNNMQRVQEDPSQFAAQGDQVRDALYNQLTRFNDERFGREEQAERTRLANMGFVQGTAAYDNALREFRRSKDESYSGAANQAILMGGAEQSRLYADMLAGRASNVGLGQAQFGQDQARYQQGLAERQAQFDAGMAGRDQTLEEQMARFQTGLAGRQQVEQEALNRFQTGMAGRDQTLEEQLARFQTGLAGRQQGQQEALDRFQTGLQGRQQTAAEAQQRFEAGMAGRGQTLAESQARQQALAQNYGLGLDERQTAFNANLARQGFNADMAQSQLTADLNRYQMGLGERQAQQQSQMNQQALASQQRQQLFQEQAYARSLPLNEITALMSGSGVTMPQFQGFQPMQAWQGPQLLDAEMARYNAQLGASNAAAAGRGQMFSTLGSLGGTLGAAMIL